MFNLQDISFKTDDHTYLKIIELNVLRSFDEKHGTFVLIE